MYIIYSGEYGVYVFKNKTGKHDHPDQDYRAVATIGANTVVGDKAVTDKFDSGKRSATVVAHTEVVTLVVTKHDY